MHRKTAGQGNAGCRVLQRHILAGRTGNHLDQGTMGGIHKGPFLCYTPSTHTIQGARQGKGSFSGERAPSGRDGPHRGAYSRTSTVRHYNKEGAVWKHRLFFYMVFLGNN